MPFYRKMRQYRSFQILRFLHFSDNKNRCGKTADRLRNMRTIFYKLNDSYATY